MPPRYAYWTIIAGGLPTAFRATDREELLPTFQRIREKHPDAQMKWFARGKLWDSPDAARIRHDDGRGQDRRGRPSGPPRGDQRGRDWRPGGEHRDPRQKFVDAKKQKNAALRKDRWDRKNAPPRERPHGDPLRDEVRRRPPPAGRDTWRDRPQENRGGTPQRPWQDRSHAPRGPQPKPAWRDQPPAEPRRDLRDRPPAGPKRDWRDRPPEQKRDWRDRPPAEPRRDSRDRPLSGPKPDWRDRPPAPRGAGTDRPWRDRPRDPSRRGEGNTGGSRGGGAKAGMRGPQPGGWKPKPGFRGQGTEEPGEPPRPRGPNREPRRDETAEPAPPPAPDEPKVPAPGPSERGHIKSRRPFRPHGPPKGPRR